MGEPPQGLVFAGASSMAVHLGKGEAGEEVCESRVQGGPGQVFSGQSLSSALHTRAAEAGRPVSSALCTREGAFGGRVLLGLKCSN